MEDDIREAAAPSDAPSEEVVEEEEDE